MNNKLYFRIYGKEGKKIWKLAWASQGTKRDIQYGSHISGGMSHTSIHQSGEVHTTTEFNGKKEYSSTIMKPYSLNDFKGMDYFNMAGIAKDSLKSIPIQRKSPKNFELFYFDLSKYNSDINFWFFLVEKRLIEEVIEEMCKEFPGVEFAYPKKFDPTLLIAILDPEKHGYGKLLNIKAKENAVKMIVCPRDFKITLKSLKIN